MEHESYLSSSQEFRSACYRQACAIPDPDTDTVVITGGWWTQTTVSRYSVRGWQEDLPGLITGRRNHACAGYMSGGRRVRKMSIMWMWDGVFKSVEDVPC